MKLIPLISLNMAMATISQVAYAYSGLKTVSFIPGCFPSVIFFYSISSFMF